MACTSQLVHTINSNYSRAPISLSNSKNLPKTYPSITIDWASVLQAPQVMGLRRSDFAMTKSLGN